MDISYPILSIVIPSYGRQNSLNALLRELGRQIAAANFDKEVEIIVIDDGTQSPLQNPEVSVKILWLRLAINSGAPAARKFGFSKANGKFIHFHDSDDSVEENWLCYLINKLHAVPDIDFLLGARKVLKENGQEFRVQSFIKKFEHSPNKIACRLNFNNCFGPLGGLTFSRAAVNSMQFNDLKSCQDWDMCLDAINQGSKIVCDENLVFIKNERSQDRVSNQLSKKLMGFMGLGRIHNTEISKYKIPITRLYYIHCIYKNFNHLKNKPLNEFYKKKKLLILFCVFIVEAKKLAQHVNV